MMRGAAVGGEDELWIRLLLKRLNEEVEKADDGVGWWESSLETCERNHGKKVKGGCGMFYFCVFTFFSFGGG